MLGTAVWGLDLLPIPLSPLSFIVFFRLLSKNWYQTMSTWFALFNSEQIYWIKLFSGYCWNTGKGVCFNKCASAPPSNILQSKVVINLMASTYLLDLIITWSEMESWYNWFLWLINMALSPSRNCLATYKLLNKVTPFFNPWSFCNCWLLLGFMKLKNKNFVSFCRTLNILILKNTSWNWQIFSFPNSSSAFS